MAKIKLRTKQDVSIRKNMPWRKDDNLKGIIYKGQEFELDVEIIEDNTCELISGNKKWYKDQNGDFLWSGGFDVVTGEITNIKESAITNYNDLFSQIPENYKSTKGKGVKIAVLDSGIDTKHVAFANAIKGQNVASDSTLGIHDKTGHGTHCAGIIGARAGSVTGIAPMCDLYISKVITDKGNIFAEDVVSALKWAIQVAQVDVINMSFGVNQNNDLDQLLQEARNKNIIVIASAGENDILNANKNFLYPAIQQNCVSVGAIDQTFISGYKNNLNTNLELMMPYMDVYSCWLNNTYENEKGSSMSSAFVAGIVGLIKASFPNPKNAAYTDVMGKLNLIANIISNKLVLKNNLELIKAKEL